MQITNCTALISPSATDKNIIMYQLKPVKQSRYPKNKQLDNAKHMHDGNNALSITSRIREVCIKTQNLLSDLDVYFV